MGKREFIDQLSAKACLSKAAAAHCIETLLETIHDGLVKQGVVRLSGFGVFRVVRRKARKARHPKTGEIIEVPEKRGVSFKPSPKLTDPR